MIDLLTVLKYIFVAYLVSSYKSLPGAYFFRFWYYVAKNLLLPIITGRETKNIKTLEGDKMGVFSHTILSTYCSPFECDNYFHKSNSTYFEELDFARTDLMSKIFQKLFLFSRSWPYIPVAEVSTCFFKDISPFQPYQITSSIFCWDKKWIYVISKFTVNKRSKLVSVAITRYVLKNGRKTIKPEEALTFCGMYNKEVAGISEKNLRYMDEHNGFENIQKLLELGSEHKEI